MAEEPTPEDIPEPTLDAVDPVTLIPVPVFDTEPAEPPRVMVVGSELVARYDSSPIRIPLTVPHRLLPQLEDKSPRHQLYIVLRDQVGWWRLLRAARLIRRIENLDVGDSRELVMKFWQAYGERQEARLGESLSSSAS